MFPLKGGRPRSGRGSLTHAVGEFQFAHSLLILNYGNSNTQMAELRATGSGISGVSCGNEAACAPP